MRQAQSIACIIPALNEAEAIGRVVANVPSWVDRVVVADNGSSDGTGDVARAAGAEVVFQNERGYGAACLMAMDATSDVDIIVFLDGDNSDDPSEMGSLVDPIVSDQSDFVLGSRVRGEREVGSLTPQQIFGNWLATRLIALIWREHFTDLGPFRAIRRASLDQLHMADRTYGWTVEMQVKAVENGLRIQEVPVSYKNRIGVSKVSGTLKGTVLAGYKILSIIGRHAMRRVTKGSAHVRSRLPSATATLEKQTPRKRASNSAS